MAKKLAYEFQGLLTLLRFPFVRKELVAHLEQRPMKLAVETTNICNANCIFCAYQFQTRAQGVMAPDLFHKIVNDFAALGGGCLELTPSGGEPFVDPHIVERIRMARALPQIGIIRMASNLILAHKHGFPEIVQSGLTQLTVSMPGFDAAIYERIYRSKMYHKVFDNLIALLTENNRAGSPLDIVLGIRGDQSLVELSASPDFQKVAALLPPEKIEIAYRFNSWGGKVGADLLPPGMKLKQANRLRHPRISPCSQLYLGAMVFWDGTVGGCTCVDIDARDLLIGDLRHQSLAEVWRGPALAALRQGFDDGQPPEVCRQCNEYLNLSHCLRPGNADFVKLTPG
ncbi:radical SAM protein [Magnetospirillum molischianum]|uniref:Radical SAM protein n=1 Tax=Magnetospirillum molischianum DSM 120 TaxID=1150626 RepID=H8FSN9_MAGML|nr:radical SAM protein [Magnetospirillum molischianum]CCG41377.1 hypothetical protein PHAMO_270218 [Magnetospirillum molischianum DSM 120]